MLSFSHVLGRVDVCEKEDDNSFVVSSFCLAVEASAVRGLDDRCARRCWALGLLLEWMRGLIGFQRHLASMSFNAVQSGPNRS